MLNCGIYNAALNTHQYIIYINSSNSQDKILNFKYYNTN